MIQTKQGEIIITSCRKCSECMQVRANEWGVRCHHELMEHEENCFLTLTYENNPIRLHKEHLQKFIKRLRKKIYPRQIKYFSCGEYGDHELRPHYHIIIFGYDFQDKEYWKRSKSGKAIFTSKELEKLWGFGYCTVQEANKQTAMYSAKYSTKLKTDLPVHLERWPEFNTMSKNLGIKGIMQNIEKYLETKEVYLDGFAYQIPRICLEKYCDDNGLDKKSFMQDYWDDRVCRTASELETRRRLAKKKKLHQEQRTL